MKYIYNKIIINQKKLKGWSFDELYSIRSCDWIIDNLRSAQQNQDLAL